TVGYYAQAVSGQLELWRSARPIAERLEDPALTPALKARLARVLVMRDFASRELALPDNQSYRAYADLGRPFVVWNVFAAPEFSVKPEQSCFPIAGCVTYRGWFSQAAAEQYAAQLRARGLDVYVGGVPAYSTLGWFNDPVLNTFVNYPEPELARLLFHELAHQQFYLGGDTVFNESFAGAGENEGVRRWLRREGAPGQLQQYETIQNRRREFIALVLANRARLERLYAEDIAAGEMRSRKAAAFATMRADYEVLKASPSWAGFAGYDRFFAQSPNNAHLASVAAYAELVPGFQALLAEQGGDLAKFYAAVRELARLPKDERNLRLGLKPAPKAPAR
ncbi:MAG: aminopeptidase, partial [Hyphomicrobium sp.]|nr:aminopeptidase [Hyphomicrobium sp.]